ncbi:hypothetical protein CS238_05360 [Salmonella enterica]|nr:hypothetical protein [Salmonella enterica]EJC8747815.1 hypothetical protein [Salmonella enterica]HCM1648876.1 hypothetical protein [Salmonella enterica subsp. diarizonae serovar 48:i:z35]
MKLELKIGNKLILEPDFRLFYHRERKDVIIIGIENFEQQDERKINDALESDHYQIHFENAIFCIETQDGIYSFDLSSYFEDFYCQLNAECFFIAIAFIDNDSIIKASRTKMIGMAKR